MYVTASEMENFMGISHTDLKVEGREMTAPEWIQFVQTYQRGIAGMIHRYCRVVTFDPSVTEALVTEYKSGRGATDDTTPYIRGSQSVSSDGGYLETDVEFYLKHLYFTGTAKGVVRAPVVIEEDTACKTAIPAWTSRTARSALAGGDYEVYTEDELTMIRFHNNVPRRGVNNVRMTYYTGYDPTSEQYETIKLQVQRCFKNFVMLKKKIGEPFTIRAHGVRDFTTMFDPFDESHILSQIEKDALEPFRRYPITGDMFG